MEIKEVKKELKDEVLENVAGGNGAIYGMEFTESPLPGTLSKDEQEEEPVVTSPNAIIHGCNA